MPDLPTFTDQDPSLESRHQALKRVLREQADALAAAGAEIEASRLLLKSQKAEHERELQGWAADLAKIELERQAEREQALQSERIRQELDLAQAELAHRDALAKAAELEHDAQIAGHRRRVAELQDARDMTAAERDRLKGRLDELQAQIDSRLAETGILRTEIDDNAAAYEAMRGEALESRRRMVAALKSEEEAQAALRLERTVGQERLRLAHAAADLRLGHLQAELDAHQARARMSALSRLRHALARLRRRVRAFTSSTAMAE